MNNCFFEDSNLYLNVQPLELFEYSGRSYHIIVRISRKDVLRLMERDIVPTHDKDSLFSLKVRVTNNTHIRLNGIRVTNLSDERLRYIPIDLVTIKELSLRRYSSKTNIGEQCYADRLILQVKDKKGLL